MNRPSAPIPLRLKPGSDCDPLKVKYNTGKLLKRMRRQVTSSHLCDREPFDFVSLTSGHA